MTHKKKQSVTLTISQKIVLLIMGILAIIALTLFALTQYKSAISSNVQAVSKIYLEEISQREVAHLENNFDMHFGTLNLAEAMLKDLPEQDIPQLQIFLEKMQEILHFDYIYLLDNEGNYCSPTEYKSAVNKINSLEQLIKGDDRIIEFNEATTGEDSILLGLPIDPLTIDGKRFVAIAAGTNIDNFVKYMSFAGFRSQTRTSIITPDGEYIVYTGSTDSTQMGTNLFSILERKALMGKGFTVDNFKNNLINGRKGMSVFTLNEVPTFLYYAPVAGTNWFITSEMPYSVINNTVEEFMVLTAVIGMLVVAIVVVLLIIFFFLAFRTQMAKSHAENIGQTLKATGIAKQQAEDALHRMAFYDELTGIPNKNLFRKSLKKLLIETSKYAYVVLDIRKFKVINDLFGYSRGDLLLKHVAGILQTEIKTDESASRFSDDIFHLLICFHNKFDLEERLQKITNEVCTFPFAADSMFHISVNFGVYIIENIDESVEQIGDRASLALKTIKNQHTTSVFYYNNDIRDRILEEQEIENEMHSGIQNNEFVVYYQPKYTTNSEMLAGSEALVRWQHKKRGLIPPNLFIPVFEKNGFITTLDLYVLETTCKNLRKWIDEGRNVTPVSINQSRLLLYSSGYMDCLTELTEKYQIPHSLIELEVTESVFLEDTQRMISIMQQLHALDFSISMDDFGSGYSTLNMLKEIMVDTLKIDKDFFSESANTQRGRTIVSNIITMAGALNIKVVAEGVETQEQVSFLRSSGCDLLQGFYYSKPIPIDEFEKLMSSSQ